MALFKKTTDKGGEQMAKESNPAPSREGVISIIGPGMKVIGDCETEGTLRIEGTVEGTVKAGKAVVIGKDGVVIGDVATQDAVIGGRVVGTVIAESRLELQATCVIEGEISAKRLKLDEGGKVNGTVHMGENGRHKSVVNGSLTTAVAGNPPRVGSPEIIPASGVA